MKNCNWLWKGVFVWISILSHLRIAFVRGLTTDKCIDRDGFEGLCIATRYCNEAKYKNLVSCGDDIVCCTYRSGFRSGQPSPDTTRAPPRRHTYDDDDRLGRTTEPSVRRTTENGRPSQHLPRVETSAPKYPSNSHLPSLATHQCESHEGFIGLCVASRYCRDVAYKPLVPSGNNTVCCIIEPTFRGGRPILDITTKAPPNSERETEYPLDDRKPTRTTYDADESEITTEPSAQRSIEQERPSHHLPSASQNPVDINGTSFHPCFTADRREGLCVAREYCLETDDAFLVECWSGMYCCDTESTFIPQQPSRSTRTIESTTTKAPTRREREHPPYDRHPTPTPWDDYVPRKPTEPPYDQTSPRVVNRPYEPPYDRDPPRTPPSAPPRTPLSGPPRAPPRTPPSRPPHSLPSGPPRTPPSEPPRNPPSELPRKPPYDQPSTRTPHVDDRPRKPTEPPYDRLPTRTSWDDNGPRKSTEPPYDRDPPRTSLVDDRPKKPTKKYDLSTLFPTKPTSTYPPLPLHLDPLTQNSGCGIKHPFKKILPFVVGGHDAVEHWPWMAAIHVSRNGFRPKYQCGGSLITNRHVLTTAHCFDARERGRDRYSVLVGTSYIVLLPSGLPASSSGQFIDVLNIRIHEQYVPGAHYKDIALLTLESKVPFSNQVSPVCLPSPDVVTSYSNLTLTGWGSTRFGGAESKFLQEVQLRFVPFRICQQSYDEFQTRGLPQGITADMLCAGNPQGGLDACKGDSGSPLVGQREGGWVQVGIVAFGVQCGSVEYPGVYTRVSAFIEWISQILSEYQYFL